MPLRPLHHQIDAAMPRFVNGAERIVNREAPLLDGRKRMARSLAAVELAAGGEHGVAYRFGIESMAALPPEELVLRIKRRALGMIIAGRLIRLRQHDPAVELFQR